MLNNAWRKVIRVVQDADVYGQPVSLSYNRHNKFKTKIGGFSTIVLGAFVAVYFSFLLYGLFARSTVNYSTTTTVRDITQDPKVLEMGKNGFKITVGMSGHNESFLSDNVRKHVELLIYEREWILQPDGTYKLNRRDLQMEEWGVNFPYFDKQKVYYFRFDKYICITTDDFEVAGSYYSHYFKEIVISVRKWNNSTYSGGWETPENIDEFIKYKEVDITMIDHYFDFHSFDNPIKSYMTQRYYYSFLKDYYKYAQVYIRENNLELMDSVFQYQDYDRKKFYSIADEVHDYYEGYDNYWALIFRADDREITHTRTVYSLFDMVAQIGGVYGVLSSIALLIFGSYSERMMYYWVLRKSYQFNSKEETTIPVYTEDEKKKLGKNKAEDVAFSPSKTQFLKSRRESFWSPSDPHLNLRKSLLNKNVSDTAEKEEVHF
jgi:hypothetical protein